MKLLTRKHFIKMAQLTTGAFLFANITPTAFAHDLINTDLETLVSIETYETAFQEECAKYGIEFNVLQYDPNTKITSDMFDASLNELKMQLQDYSSMRSSETSEIAYVNVSEQLLNSNDEANTRSMYLTTDVFASFHIENVYGSAEMQLKSNVTSDIQKPYVLSVNSSEAYQLGTFVNFQDWTTTSIASAKNTPLDGYITYTVSGRAAFSYADPYTGVLTGLTSSENKTLIVQTYY